MDPLTALMTLGAAVMTAESLWLLRLWKAFEAERQARERLEAEFRAFLVQQAQLLPKQRWEDGA